MVYCKLFSWLFLSVGCYIASCKAVSHCFMLWGGAITLLHVGGRVIALIHAEGGVIITLLHVGRRVIALMRTCRGRGHHHIASCRGKGDRFDTCKGRGYHRVTSYRGRSQHILLCRRLSSIVSLCSPSLHRGIRWIEFGVSRECDCYGGDLSCQWFCWPQLRRPLQPVCQPAGEEWH